MKKTLVLVVVGVLALAGLLSVLTGSGFWLLFIGLTFVYAVVSVGIIYLTAVYYENKRLKGGKATPVVVIDPAPDPLVLNPKKETTSDLFFEYLGDNNTWFFVLLGVCAITFVIACFNFGPAVLLPEKLPTAEQRGFLSNLGNHLLYGKGAPKKVIPTEPLFWATGTWFWWKAWFLYGLLTFGYFWFAFWDEATEAIKFVKTRLHEAHEEELARRKEAHTREKDKVVQKNKNRGKGEPETAIPTPPPNKLSFAEFLKWDLAVELAVEVARALFFKR